MRKEIVSRREFAARLNIGLPQLCKYIKRGLPESANGIDFEDGVCWVIRNIVPQGGRNSGRGSDKAWSIFRGRE